MIERSYEPENLDGLDPSELDKLASVYEKLASYAKAKAPAMRARGSGRIGEAAVLETECERIYNALPQWAKW